MCIQINFGLFQNNAIYKLFVHKSYMFKEDLALNNLQGLICYKTLLTNYLHTRIKSQKGFHLWQCYSWSPSLSHFTFIWNWEFSLSYSCCHTKVDKPSLPYYLLLAGERIVGLTLFCKVLALSETVSLRIWTQEMEFTSYK